MIALTALLCGLAVLVLLGARGRDPLARAFPQGRRGRPRPGPVSAPVAACAVAGVAVAVAGASLLAVAAGAGVAIVGPRLLARLEPRAVREEREQLLHELPLLLDLLAACLAGGAPLPVAAAAVAEAVPGPAGRRLSAVAAALGVGLPASDAWLALAGEAVGASGEDPLLPAARALSRAADGGAPVAATVSRLAAEARAEARARGEQAARRVGVLAVAPLGLCFLPAFVLLGVVPVVVGLAGPLLAAF